MRKNPITPHRPSREEKTAKEMSDLKRENHKLKRTVKRLEKEIDKRAEVEADIAEKGLEEEGEKIQETVYCKACNGEQPLRQLLLNGKVYEICPVCKARTKIGEAIQ